MLEEVRSRIDKIDDELVRLFTERLLLVEEVANKKKAENLPILNTAREREIISRLTKGQTDTVAGYIKVLFTVIFDLSRSHQAKLINAPSEVAAEIRSALKNTSQLFPKSTVVACQGSEGSDSTLACEKLFERPSIMHFNTFDGVLGAVDKNLCQYAILPESDLRGSIADTYDLIKKHKFFIVRSVRLKTDGSTKFVCVSKRLEIYPGARKISLIMTAPHRTGSLYQLLAKFAALGINLVKLEGRPMSDNDVESMFYFDLDISVYDEAVFNLFSQLESGDEKFTFLGCYSET